MKYPYLNGKFATIVEACRKRDELNERKNPKGTKDCVSYVKRMHGSWNVYTDLVNNNPDNPKAKGHPHHEESELQRTCVEWFRLKYHNNRKLLFAVPNGGYRNPREAAIMRAEGVLSGVSDLILLIPSSGYHGLCIEMKTATGRQSANQTAWQEIVECNGYRYQICRSFDEFKETIEEYMPKPPVYIPRLHG